MEEIRHGDIIVDTADMRRLTKSGIRGDDVEEDGIKYRMGYFQMYGTDRLRRGCPGDRRTMESATVGMQWEQERLLSGCTAKSRYGLSQSERGCPISRGVEWTNLIHYA